MIKLLTTITLNKTAWIGFFVALAAFFIMASTIYAQNPPTDEHEEAVRKHGVTFPIAGLGGCKDYSDCRSFCEDPLNATSCINFAKQKGFYKEESFEVNNKILETAKTALGCDSKTSCLNFCEVPANRDKCDSFAKGQGLVGGKVEDPSRTQVISRAKEALGCESATGCQSLCSKEENRQKCSEFAKTVGLHGGEHKVGPGGCTSENTCKSFCSDPANYQVCSGFTSVAGGKFTGPGGCDSEASCRAYCQSNEKACSSVFGGPGSGDAIQTKYDPVDMCNRTPNCAWSGNTCQCGFYGETTETAHKAGEYAGYCKANPEKCKPGQAGSFDTTGHRQEFESFCTQNPEKCKSPTGGTGGIGAYHDPAVECARYGCSWTNNTCQCGGIKDYDPVSQCNKTPNCAWTGSSCQCSSSSPLTYPTPYSGGQYSPQPYQTPGTYPSPSYYSPTPYQTPGVYSSPYYHSPSPYQTPGTYGSPSSYSPPPYATPGTYQTPYSYQTPSGTYQTPYSYHTPSGGYGTPSSYGTPSYGTPAYGTPSYSTPSYGTPSYGTPSYGTPSYGTPESYATPPAYQTPSGGIHGASTRPSLLDLLLQLFR